MKKDIEWLKDEVNELPLRFLGFSMLKQREEFAVSKDDVLELINQLDEPEVLSQEWIDDNKVARINNVRKMTMDDVVPVDKLQNLIVPKQEGITEEQAWEVIHGKYGDEVLQNNIDYVESQGYVVTERPTIPQFIADYLPLVKEDIELEKASYYAVTGNELPKWKREYDWIRENFETFVKAWLDGYTVEEEAGWIIREQGTNFVLNYLKVKAKDTEGELSISTGWSPADLKGYVFKHEQQANAVAELIDRAVKVEELKE